MKFAFSHIRQTAVALVLSISVWPQTSAPPLQVINFKIEGDYSRLLDRKGSDYTAENPDLPRTEVERIGPPPRRRAARTEQTRAHGRLRSELRIVSDAQWINLTVRNTGQQTIKVVTWDFAFPRYENGLLVLRQEVRTTEEIKPGNKKTLKYQLPPNAKKCAVVVLNAAEKSAGEAKPFEAVCGPGFNDPSLLKERQESIAIKRIEYLDGSIWQRQ
jgi:hypothetical protein